MIKLNKLKIELMKTDESHSFTLELHRLSSSKWFKIYLATILIVLIAYYINSIFTLIFGQINGPIKLSKDKQVAEHTGPDFVSGSFRINRIYSKGIHHVQLSFEQFSSSDIFIGIRERIEPNFSGSSSVWLSF